MIGDKRLKLSQELDVLIVDYYKGGKKNIVEIEEKRQELEKVVLLHEQMKVVDKISYGI